LVEVFVCPDIGILYDFFGFTFILENAPNDSEQALVIAAHEDFVEIAFAVPDALNDLLVGQHAFEVRSFMLMTVTE
jgi:hypothetical protein